MRRFFIVLGVCALLVFSIQLISAIKNECCPGHFQVFKAYQESMQSLIDKIKGENVEQFEQRYHNKEALTYLDLLHGSLEDIADHYKEISNAEDEAATRSALERVEKYAKQLKAAKGAEAKKLVESMDVTI
jgi:hypothetical protein